MGSVKAGIVIILALTHRLKTGSNSFGVEEITSGKKC